MWTILNNQEEDSFFKQYSNLLEFYEDIVLYDNTKYNFKILPRYFVSMYPSRYFKFYIDKEFVPKTIDVTWNKNLPLKNQQKQICSTILNRLNDEAINRGGIIKARPGAGKTVMSIYIACASKKKTLIVVDNKNLVEQWKDTIIKFTNCDENNIGTIQANIFDTDHPFTIAMLQTLVSRIKNGIEEFYKKMRNSGFDLVFFDECHKTTCGPKYAKASLLINTKNIIGLSATPFANHLHKILMTGTIGEIIAEDSEYELVPTINFIRYKSGLSSRYGKQIFYINDYLKQRSKFISKLPESIKYKDIILMLVKQMLSEGHKIIIICFTVELVKYIYEWLLSIGIEGRVFYSKETEIDKENDNLIITTYAFAGAGFDMKQLSGIILATPLSGKKSLIQGIGRILRSHEGKMSPVVYDLIDTDFGDLFTKEISRKKSILSQEFNCNFKDITIY